jgi:transcriptional regulator with XRE-family HTH domain
MLGLTGLWGARKDAPVTKPMRKYWFAEWREHAGLSQRQLAKVLGVSKTTISRIERGTRGFTGDFLEDFHQAVGTPTVGTALDHAPPENHVHKHARKSDRDLIHMQFARARELRKLVRDKRDSGPQRKRRQKKEPEVN